MHRLAVLIVVAACNLVPAPASAPADAAAAAALDAAPVRLDAAPDAAPAPTPAARALAPAPAVPANNLAIAAHPSAPHVTVAAPAQALRALAVTQDGTAAVSSDIGGAVRLWPTLDGTREPVVVAMRRPVSLAVTRDGQDLEIAGIDGAGQLELARVSATGEPIHRTSVELARPTIAVHATPYGFLVERDDQHIELVAANGTIAGEVEPPPGSHVAAIAVQGDTMLALLDTGNGVHLRKLIPAHGVSWDDPTPALPIAPHGIALSPSHKKVAAVIETAQATQLALFDVARGRRVLLGPESGFVNPTLEPVGFLDETTVVVRTSGTLALWHATADDNTLNGFVEQRRAPAIAVGGSHAVIGNGASLTIADGSGTLRYLGFRVPSVTAVAGGAYSLLATDGVHVMRLGADLQEHASYALPDPHGDGHVPTLLDGTHVLIQSYYERPHVDVIALETMQIVALAGETQLLAYDPVQRLAAFRETSAVRFKRFDGKTGTFGKGVELALDNNNDTASITFGGGDRTFVTTTYDTKYTVRTVRSINPDRGSLKVTGKRSGDLQFVGEGMELPPELPPDLPPAVHTVASPDGTLVASYGDGRLTLRDVTGAVRWTVPNGGAWGLTWLHTGELLATGGGLARVDLATGAFLERRCGWEFGLWPEPIDTFASTSICDAE